MAPERVVDARRHLSALQRSDCRYVPYMGGSGQGLAHLGMVKSASGPQTCGLSEAGCRNDRTCFGGGVSDFGVRPSKVTAAAGVFAQTRGLQRVGAIGGVGPPAIWPIRLSVTLEHPPRMPSLIGEK